MRRWILSLLLVGACLRFPAARAEMLPWRDALEQAYPGWEIICAVNIGEEQGILAVLARGDVSLTVVADQNETGNVCLHENDELFPGMPPTHDELWLGAGMQPEDAPPCPFLWYNAKQADERFYLVLERDETGVWQVCHMVFDIGREGASCTYCVEGGTATVYGETLYPQVRTLLTFDLTFTAFDPVEAEAYARMILDAPKEYRCYGLECMENGPCTVHGIYLPCTE